MINSIIESISVSLDAEFGSRYNIYREEKRQGLKEPCFFILCINPTNRLFLNKRYFRTNQFCIHYFPEHDGNKNEECHETAERLFHCLEWLEVDGDPVMGTKMRYEIDEGILHFFVNYDLFVRKVGEPIPHMEEISEETFAKG